MIIHKSVIKDESFSFRVESIRFTPPFGNNRCYYGDEYKTAPYPINIMCQIMIEKGIKELTGEIRPHYEYRFPYDSWDNAWFYIKDEDIIIENDIWIGKTDNDKYLAMDSYSINHHHFNYISGFDSGYAIVYKTPKIYTKSNWKDDNKKQIIKGGWGIIDRNGKILTPDYMIFDEIWSFYDMGQKGTILHSVSNNPEGEYYYFRFKEELFDKEEIFRIEDNEELKAYKEERYFNRLRYLHKVCPKEIPPIEDNWKRYTSTGEEWENEDW